MLVVDHVTKLYGGIVALSNVTLQVSERELVGIIGPNGAGKTTLLNVITGVMPPGIPRRPDGGKIFFKGVDISSWPAWKIARLGIGRTFQAVRCFQSLTVFDNLYLGLWIQKNEKEKKRKITELLEFFQLKEIANAPIARLPVGTQRIIEIARTVINEPKLLLLDEPFAGIVGSDCYKIIALVHQLNKEHNMTIMVVEHRLQELFNCVNRVIVMHEGRVIAEGLANEVISNPAVKIAYLGESDVSVGS